MSYICMAANKNGAVVAGDSRLSLHILPLWHLHHDHGVKVFSSADHRTIWAFDGLTSSGFLYFPAMVKRIMQDEKIPIAFRLEKVKALMCRFTRPGFRHRKGAMFNLLYYHCDAGGQVQCGSIGIQNGQVTSDPVYTLPVFAENGMNMNQLCPSGNCLPSANAPVSKLYQIASARVRESIEKDMELEKNVPGYQRTIGGKVCTKVVSVR